MILIWRFDKLRVSWDQKSFLTEFIFLKLEKCMWMVKQGQTDIVLEVSQHSMSLKRLISKSSWEIQKVLRKRLDLFGSKWLIRNKNWTFFEVRNISIELNRKLVK